MIPAMKACGDTSTAGQLLGIPAASPSYLHPAKVLETGLFCLPYPTLFLLRSQLAFCLSPLALLLFLQWKKLLAAGQRQGCPQRHFPSWNTPPVPGVPVPGHLPTGSMTSQVVRLFFTCFSNLMSLKARHGITQTGGAGTTLALRLGRMGQLKMVCDSMEQ